jgi:hypothetical protein
VKQWFAASKDDETPLEIGAPCRGNGAGKRLCARKATAAITVAADEIGIAEPAGCRCAILFAATPQIAARKTAKLGGTPRQRALALQRLEYLFDDKTQGSFRENATTTVPVLYSSYRATTRSLLLK